MRRRIAVVVAAGLACAAGCGGSSSSAPRNDQLDGQMIMPSRGRLPTEPYSPVDQPGALTVEGGRVVPDADDVIRPGSRRPAPPGVSAALNNAVAPLAQPFGPSDSPTTGPATRPSASPGVYQTIGGVVAEVNNTPIYADKVVSDIAPELAANAQAMGPEQFKKFATKALDSQIEENIKRELLFAAAERGLDQRDKDRAKFGAEAWRQNQITLAGGSIETARRRFAEQGRDFDVEVKEEYRRVMVVLLLQTKIYPRIQVNAADMRRYYNANRDKEFTTRDAAKFEMIMIDPAKVGGTQLAKDKIDDLHARAVRGEDFAELAKFSNGPRLRNSEGGLSWLERGAFTLVAVEEAVWKLQPGEVTSAIDDGGKFYIAKLEQKRIGRVAPFEEEATQTAIKDELTRLQFRPMYEEMLAKLYKESIVRKDPAMMRSAVEIAMQCYPQWAAK